MKLDMFINRPVLSTVISIFIVLLGCFGLISLPITQYPDIAPPTVTVMTSYPGANAQTVLNSVIVPIEEQVNGVENMDYISSSAANSGGATITITFKMGTNPDMAAVNVQNRVSKAAGYLPSEVTRIGVMTMKRQTSMLMIFSAVDAEDRYSREFLENYFKINVAPAIQRVNGVGDVNVMGGSYAMRIWLDPDKMAEHGLVPTDIVGILAEQNVEAAPGTIGERENNTFQYTLRYKGRLQETVEFENMVIKSNPDGSVLRVGDIAKCELGRESYAWGGTVNGHKAVTAMVQQIAGTNATQIVQDVEKLLEQMEPDLPSGMQFVVSQNVNDFLFASIHEVIKTLIEAFLLVFLVVFIFLQDMRSTIIPAVAIPVALIGTFFALYLIGFTINLLTLSALVLAIAIVVDDAIVVVEGVHAKLDMGYTSARKASLDAMNDLGGAIVSITLVMMAVFVPVSFLGGTSGAFYRQFGITMAIAIGFSAVNALTLSPALCAIFLKAHTPEGEEKGFKQKFNEAQDAAKEVMKKKYTPKRFGINLPPMVTLGLLIVTIVLMVFDCFQFENIIVSIIAWAVAIVAILGLFSQRFIDWFNRFYDRLLEKYKKGVNKFVMRPYLTLCLVAASIVGLVGLMAVTPTTLVPSEDSGSIMGVVTMPPGTSQDRTEKVLAQVDSMVRSSPLVETSTVVSGFSFMGGQGPSYGSVIIKLKHWNERNPIMESSNMVFINLLLEAQKSFKDAKVLFFPPPMVPGYGMSNGFTLNLQDRTGGDIKDFERVANDFIADLEARPEIQTAQTSFSTQFPQYLIDIDPAQCKRAGVMVSDVLNVLQGYYGGMYTSNFNRFGKIYRVMVQAPENQRANYESLYKIKVRTQRGQMAPITEFMTLTPTMGPDVINRFNLFTSISINGNPADGYTSGQAIKAIEEVSKTSLPVGYTYEYSGLTREEQSSSGNTTAIVFVLCIVFIYLLLSAQYESYILPLAVILSVPFGLFGSFVFIWLMGGLSTIPGAVGQMATMILGAPSNNIYTQIALIMLIGLLAKNAILIVEFALDRRKMGMSVTAAAMHGAAARLRPILMTSMAMIVGLLPLMFSFGVGANANRALGTAAIGGMLIGMICQIYVVPALFRIFQGLQERFTPMDFSDIHSTEGSADIEQYTK